jgi:1-aminocyclopropane-1-carboxylate deaminase
MKSSDLERLDELSGASPLSPPPLTHLSLSWAPRVRLSVLRDDLLHPIVSGNKWRKLSPLIEVVKEMEPRGMMSVGGLHSNHLDALSFFAQERGFDLLVWVRGLALEQLHLDDLKRLSPTLARARSRGAHLIPASRSTYDLKKHLPFFGESIERLNARCTERGLTALSTNEGPFNRSWGSSWGGWMWIPEGGGTPAALSSCARIPIEVRARLNARSNALEAGDSDPLPRRLWFTVSVGTGCTAAGILSGLSSTEKLRVYSPFKTADTHRSNQSIDDPDRALGYGGRLIKEQLISCMGTHAWRAYHHGLSVCESSGFGGFGRPSREVTEFINRFYRTHTIPLDPIYNGKAMCALFAEIEAGYFPDGSHIVHIHTGGLQGVEGMNQRTRRLGYEIQLGALQ